MFSDVKNMIILGLLIALGALSLYHFAEVGVLKVKISNRDVTIQEQETKITKLNADLKTATDANASLTKSIENQNKAVKSWEDAARIRSEEAALALAKVKLERDAWKAKFQHILTDPPEDPTDQCSSLDLRFNQYLETRGKP